MELSVQYSICFPSLINWNVWKRWTQMQDADAKWFVRISYTILNYTAEISVPRASLLSRVFSFWLQKAFSSDVRLISWSQWGFSFARLCGLFLFRSSKHESLRQLELIDQALKDLACLYRSLRTAFDALNRSLWRACSGNFPFESSLFHWSISTVFVNVMQRQRLVPCIIALMQFSVCLQSHKRPVRSCYSSQLYLEYSSHSKFRWARSKFLRWFYHVTWAPSTFLL